MPINKCRRMIEDIKREHRSRPIEAHPEFNSYIKREQCQQMLHNNIRGERQKLLDKYACYDGATYRKGSCEKAKTIADFNIKDHPDFSKYVARSEVANVLSRQVKKVENRPIEQHPDYQKLRRYFTRLLQSRTDQLKSELGNQPIEQHRDYRRLMDTYACSEGDCDAKRYIPCPSCKPKVKLSDFDINDHPDIDKYILKEEAKQVSQQLIDSIKRKYGFFCPSSKSYQPCTKKPKCEINAHPELAEYVKKIEYQQLENRLKTLKKKYSQIKEKQNKLIESTKKSQCESEKAEVHNIEDGVLERGPTPIRPLYMGEMGEPRFPHGPLL